MGNQLDHSSVEVLHVRPSDSAIADSLSRAVVDAGGRERCFSDVYLALASLGAPCGRELRCVLLCVDGIAREEIEFVSLARRLRPSVTVLAYSALGESQRLREAMQAGANGTADALGVRQLLQSVGRVPVIDNAERTACSAANETSTLPGTVAPSRGLADETEPVEEPDDDRAVLEADGGIDEPVDVAVDESEADAPQAPARVPWLRYAPTAERIAPDAATDVEAETSVDDIDGEEEPIDSCESLLTPDELEALLGDVHLEPTPRREPRGGGL